MELQADCLAGVWGQAAEQRGLLDPGDVEAGAAAPRRPSATTGSSRQATGRVSPESFTHGSAAQRAAGSGAASRAASLDDCDTFASRTP